MRAAALLACLVAGLAAAGPARADHARAGTVALVGSLQSELGCPGDWQPECAATRLQAVAGSPGVYRATFDVPAGDYEYKVALNGSWDENYGAGGAAGGANIPIPATGGPVTFTYDHGTHVISDDAPRPPAGGARRALAPCRRDRLAPARRRADLPAALRPGGRPRHRRRRDRRRLRRCRWSATRPGCRRTCARSSRTSPRGRPAALLRRAGARAGAAEGRARGGRLRRRRRAARGYTGVQIPGVLDDVYASADGPGSARVERPQARPPPVARRLGADRQGRRVAARPAGPAAERRVAMRRGEDGVWRVSGDRSWRNAAYRYEVRVYVPTLDRVVTNVVTDPYSVALTTNSGRSVLADLDDPALAPHGWDGLRKPALARPRTPRSTSCTSGTSRSPTRPCPRRTAARTSRSPTATATACATCATSRGPG